MAQEKVTIGGLNQDEAIALLEVHSQRIETGDWPKRIHAERGQSNRTEVFRGLIRKGILDNPEENDTLRITPKGRDALHAVCEVLINTI